MLSRHDTEAIAKLQTTLPDGQYRFAASSAPLHLSWFPQEPSIEDVLLADYATTDPEEEEHIEALRLEWNNEMAALTQSLEEIQQEQPQAQAEGARERMWAGLNKRASALGAWDAYAVPLRVRGQRVFRIWAPRDVMGTPIIKSIPIKLFVTALCQETAAATVALSQLRAQVRRWRGAAFLLAAAAVALAIAVLL